MRRKFTSLNVKLTIFDGISFSRGILFEIILRLTSNLQGLFNASFTEYITSIIIIPPKPDNWKPYLLIVAKISQKSPTDCWFTLILTIYIIKNCWLGLDWTIYVLPTDFPFLSTYIPVSLNEKVSGYFYLFCKNINPLYGQ